VPRFGSSGIRGIANVDITTDFALDLGKILGELYGPSIVGRDPRTTGPMLASALFAGLMSSGADTVDAGIVSTPTLARGASSYGCGVVVTASHNPAPYNGIKLWNPDGIAFDERQQSELEAAMDRHRFRSVPWDRAGSLSAREDLIDRHVESILKDVGVAHLRVVVDCACGATSTITPRVLREMGCEVLAIHAQMDGHFPGRDPEPTEENVAFLRSTVRSTRADLGIAHDGDGDRMVAVDRTGAYLGGDALLALFSKHVGARTLVVPVDASMRVEDLLPHAKIWRTRVGDVYVAQEVKRRRADFGGEPSGTWIFPESSLCPDGVYAAARLVALAAEHPDDVLASSLPPYPTLRGTLPFDPARRASIEDRLGTALPALSDRVDTPDGWRIRFDAGWALVRFSGTEPKIRIVAEARTEAEAKEIYGTVLSTTKGAL
jgi:phosphoglucosamine mutase